MNKKTYGFIGATLIIFFFLPLTHAQSDLESARTSVVKVTTGFSVRNPNTGRMERRLGTGTGFCWQESMYVVTALHVVAGVNEITVHNSSGKSSGASIVNVLLEADLALLKLNSNLGLIPLKLEPVNPNLGNNFTVWGFPHAVFKMQDNEIRLSRSLEANPILDHLINGDKLKYELEKQKYPSPNVSILKIASIIQPGQSGAPLLTSDGKVVGVADGGLRGGTALLNWAMPAATYVPRLSSSRDPIPSTVSIQSSLYSSSTTILAEGMPADSEEESDEDETDYDYYQILASEESENTIHMNGHYITKTWTASFNDIISTLSMEEAGEIMQVLDDFDVNMDDTYYDIYEDYDSGATISIPYGEQFDVADGWFYTCNADQSLCYYVLPYESDNFEAANYQAIELFNSFLESGDWEIQGDYEEDDETEFDEYEEEATYSFTRLAANEGDDRVLQYTANIIDSGLLVGILIYDESEMDDNNYRKQFLHFLLALEMRDFAKY
jgi:S1-C subfamily serine protease